MHKHTLTPSAKTSYKTGVDEIVGLADAMRLSIKPLLDHLNELDDWCGDGWFKMESAEYKGRDGFIPHSHNFGGVEIGAVVPKCGEYNFSFLEFGEIEREPGQSDEDWDAQRDIEESDGHLEAVPKLKLR